MQATLNDLLKQRAQYERASENGHLQEKELRSIAISMLSILGDEHLEAKEKEAYEWAKKQIKG